MKITLRDLFQVGCVTNIFEWYEFTLYSYLALSIGHNFFNSTSNIIALLQSLAVFSLSYLIRPVGSIFFGYIGDKYHSQVALKYSMIIMAIPTVLIGVLPTFSQVGILATILLIVLRLIQGFAAGGELPSCAAYVFDITSNSPNKNFLCGLVNVGGMIGVLFASLIVFLLYFIASDDVIQAWAWRIPFLLGLPLSIIIIRTRNKLRIIQTSDTDPKYELISRPFILIFLKAAIIISFLQVSFYLLFVWMPIYLEHFLGVTHHNARISNVIALIFLVFSTGLFAYIGKFINYKKLILFSVLASLFFSFLLFHLLANASIYTVILIQLIFVIIMAPLQGSYIIALGNIFKSNNLNRGIALSFTIPTALFGGTAPFICSYFIHILNYVDFPGIYLTCFSLVALPAILLL